MRERPPISVAIQKVRKSRHQSQSEFGELVSLSQGAISRIESGDFSAISSEKLAEICEILQIPYEWPQQKEVRPRSLVFCPTATCPANFPFLLEGRLVVQPHMVFREMDDSLFCQSCGGRMLDKCPNHQCGYPASAGAAFCARCGMPLIQLPKELIDLPDPKSFVLFQLSQREKFLKNTAEIQRNSLAQTETQLKS